MFTFLHAADIHLDSPLRNLAVREDAPVELIRGAARRAFDNLIQLAIEEEVDFLLLAGDLYDGSWKDYNTGLFFIDRISRLKKAGIRVFLVSGNHDAASRITRALRLPDNVTHFSSHRPETVLADGLPVAVHGQSYGRSSISENLALAYPVPVSGVFNIGLLHTGLSGRPGHQPYAPCSRADLIHKGYDYWALGHVHQREEVCPDPWIIFPGNLQGRHIRETGAKGATLVRVENGRVTEVSARELDVVRWGQAQLDCGKVTTQEELFQEANIIFAEQLELAGDRPLMLRLELRASSPFHEELLHDCRYWENELAALAMDSGDIWLEKVLFHTLRLQKTRKSVFEGSPLDDFFQSIGEENVELLGTPELQVLLNRLPPELLRENPLIPEDSQEQEVFLEEIRDMLLARILRQVRK